MPAFQPINRMPMVQRDLAFQVSVAIRYADMEAAMRSALKNEPLCGIIRSAQIFDIFQPQGEAELKSMAFRLQLQDVQTLTDARVDAACNALIDVVTRATGAQLRH
jgi:phenylalanyl-tRNA synthetase beta chain